MTFFMGELWVVVIVVFVYRYGKKGGKLRSVFHAMWRVVLCENRYAKAIALILLIP